MDTSYSRIADDAGLEEACPSPKQGLPTIKSLLGLVVPDPNQPIIDNQLRICQQIVLRRNHQYNVTVDMLNRLNGPYSQYLQEFDRIAQLVGTSQGALAGSQADIQRGQANLDTEMRTWQAQIQVDDQMIKYLENQQATLAKSAMRGKNTILGNIVQAATLKIAFDELNSGN
jgi:hypothetical protein